MIGVIDYGGGNLRSVENALREIGAAHQRVRAAADLRHTDKIILPGVGHFGRMMRALEASGLRRALLERIAAGAPFLGICLGMQALFEGSEEEPAAPGLGLLAGRVRRFPAGARVPHMGWNRIAALSRARLLEGTGEGAYVYFAHSYYAPVGSVTAATAAYQVEFTALLEDANVFGVQFHPEKSGDVGLRILRNFVEL